MVDPFGSERTVSGDSSGDEEPRLPYSTACPPPQCTQTSVPTIPSSNDSYCGISVVMTTTGSPRFSGRTDVSPGETTVDAEESVGDTSLGEMLFDALTAAKAALDAIRAAVTAVSRTVRSLNLRLCLFMCFLSFRYEFTIFTESQTAIPLPNSHYRIIIYFLAINCQGFLMFF